jgi:hypothetical protein
MFFPMNIEIEKGLLERERKIRKNVNIPKIF